MVTTLKRTWRHLTETPSVKTQAKLVDGYTHFQAWVAANNQVLNLMADREAKPSGAHLFELHDLNAAVSQLHRETSTLVMAINGLRSNRSQALEPRVCVHGEDVLNRGRKISCGPRYVKQLDISQHFDSMIY